MYAVIRSGGKQYRVEAGFELLVEKLAGFEEGQSVPFTDVLMIGDEQGVTVGTPKVNATVHCKYLGDEKGDKLRTIKYTRRKNFKRTYGHRQTYTRLLVEKVERMGS